MPRSSRLLVAGTYHVTARGNNSENIFQDDFDRLSYLALLAKTAGLMALRIVAYVLMTNHVHLILQTTKNNLHEAVHRLHRPYAFDFNRRYGRTGHLFGGRYHSKPIVDDVQLLESSRYIHLNPVRAGIVRSPDDYPWSSYRHYVQPETGTGLVHPDPVLAVLSNDPLQGRTSYREFVLAGLRKPSPPGADTGTGQG